MALGASLWLGCALPGWARVGLELFVLALTWRGAARLLGRGGGAPWAGGRLRWEPDGRWWYESARQQGSYVHSDPPRRLGALLWLRWTGAQGPQRCCLDGAAMELKAWALLKARMKLSAPAGRLRSP